MEVGKRYASRVTGKIFVCIWLDPLGGLFEQEEDKRARLYMKAEFFTASFIKEKIKKSGWVNIYRSTEERAGKIYRTRADALPFRQPFCVDTILIEWEEESP